MLKSSVSVVKLALACTLGLLSIGPAAQAASVESRTTYYNQFFFRSTPNRYLEVNTDTQIAGTRHLMTVLPGVLYRGGGAHGQHPLTSGALQELCKAGFSLAVYAYTVGYSNPGVISCTDREGNPNQLRYIAGGANTPEFKVTFLKAVQDVISNPNAGPIFEHCWNGDHASGELAAVALRQFCGWSGKEATDYWLRHSGSIRQPISRIGKFQPLGGLSIPGNEVGVLCAQQPF
jgi:hypothetical protein